MSEWMNPLNKIKWRQTIKARGKTHTLDDGRVFTLDYDKWEGRVWISPVKGFVPAGYFNIERVEDKDGGWIVGD